MLACLFTRLTAHRQPRPPGHGLPLRARGGLCARPRPGLLISGLLVSGLLVFGLLALTPPPAHAAIQLMGTIEFGSNLKNLPQWEQMLARNANNPIFVTGSKLNGRVSWEQFVEMMRGKSPMEQLKAVNTLWNRFPYRTDQEVYHMQDYWAAPCEFRKNSGDCEDYAIAKYFTLKALGFDTRSMRIVIVRETIRNQVHAVLVVYLDNDAYVLDNLSPATLSHSRTRQYLPQISINEHGRWVHVRPTTPGKPRPPARR